MTKLSLKFLTSWKSLLDTIGLQVKMDAPIYKRTVGDCPGSETFLSHLEFWNLLKVHFLFTQVYPSGVFDGVFDGVEEQIVIVFLCYDKYKMDINIATVILNNCFVMCNFTMLKLKPFCLNRKGEMVYEVLLSMWCFCWIRNKETTLAF